jgi:molybdopterin-dependent oxidoreductase alpha subunit
MGLTQHRNAVATIKEVVNLALAQGNIGKPGAGLLPVRGHSNVQGDRTMGIWERPSPKFLDALQKEFGFDPPRENGFDVVDSIRAMRDGKVKVFVGLGGNFVQATPDTDVTAQALRSTRLTVQISTKINRSHLVCGETALMLPTLGRTEKDIQASGPQVITVEDSTCSVHASRGPLAPASVHLRSEVAILTAVAEATLGDRYGIPWRTLREDYRKIRERIARVVPGCESYDVNVHRPGGYVMPHPPRDSRTFTTDSGKGEFVVSPIEVLQVPPGHLALQTLRSHDQFNTTIYGLSDRYRGIEGGRRVVFVHRDDITALGFNPGDMVDLVTKWDDDDVDRCAPAFRIVEYDTPRGSAAAYYPETNPLCPLDFTALSSNQPAYKSIIISMVPAGTGGAPAPVSETAEAEAVRAMAVESDNSQDAVGSDLGHKSDPEPEHLS